MKKRKFINFDLSTNELKKHFNNTAEAYNQIKKFMLANGFIHRQYSGYASKEALSEKQISKIAENLADKFSWLSTCIQEIDVTDIGEQYSLKDIIKAKSVMLDKEPNIQNNTDLNKKDNTADSKEVKQASPSESAISKMKQKIAEFEKSGKLDEITSKRNKGRDKGR